MNIDDAMNILKPEGNTIEDVKSAYRKRALEFHPDRNPHELEMMKLVNSAYELLRAWIGKWDSSKFKSKSKEGTAEYHYGPSMTDELEKIFEKIKHWIEIEVELIGDWMWVFNPYEERAMKLAFMGFSYSPARQGWYFIPKSLRNANKEWNGQKRNPEDYQPFDDIRNTFGFQKLKTDPYKQV